MISWNVSFFFFSLKVEKSWPEGTLKILRNSVNSIIRRIPLLPFLLKEHRNHEYTSHSHS